MHVGCPINSLEAHAARESDSFWYRGAEPADISAVAWQRTKRITLPETVLGLGDTGVFFVQCEDDRVLIVKGAKMDADGIARAAAPIEMLANVLFRAVGLAVPTIRVVSESGYDGGAEWLELCQAVQRLAVVQDQWARPEVDEWIANPHVLLVDSRVGRSIASMGQQEALRSLKVSDGDLLRQLGGIMAVDMLLNFHHRFPLLRDGPADLSSVLVVGQHLGGTPMAMACGNSAVPPSGEIHRDEIVADVQLVMLSIKLAWEECQLEGKGQGQGGAGDRSAVGSLCMPMRRVVVAIQDRHNVALGVKGGKQLQQGFVAVARQLAWLTDEEASLDELLQAVHAMVDPRPLPGSVAECGPSELWARPLLTILRQPPGLQLLGQVANIYADMFGKSDVPPAALDSTLAEVRAAGESLAAESLERKLATEEAELEKAGAILRAQFA